MPLSNHPFWSDSLGGLTVFKYLGAACFIYALCHLGMRTSLPSFFQTMQARLFILLVVIATWSYITVPSYVSWVKNGLLSYLSFVFLFLITQSVVDSVSRFRWVLFTAISAVGFGSVYMLREWQKFHGIYGEDFRPGWVVGDPNYFNAGALLCLPVAFCLISARCPRWERLYYLGCMLLTLAAITLGASRGGFIGLMAVSLYLILNVSHRLRNLVLLAALVIPLSLVLPSSPLHRLLHPGYDEEFGTSARLIAWQAGLNMIEEHPLGGVGLGNFKPLMVRYKVASMGTSETLQSVVSVAHNSFLEFAAELGIPGLLTFLGVLGWSYRTLAKVRRDAMRQGHLYFQQVTLGMQAGLLGFCVCAFFISGEYEKLFWLFIFLTMCLPTIYREAVKDPHVTGATVERSSEEDPEGAQAGVLVA